MSERTSALLVCAAASVLFAWNWRMEIVGFAAGIFEVVAAVVGGLAQMAFTVVIVAVFARLILSWLLWRLQVVVFVVFGAFVFGAMFVMGLADKGARLP